MITPEQHSDLARRPAALVQPADHLMACAANLLAAMTRHYLFDADAMIIRDSRWAQLFEELPESPGELVVVIGSASPAPVVAAVFVSARSAQTPEVLKLVNDLTDDQRAHCVTSL